MTASRSPSSPSGSADPHGDHPLETGGVPLDDATTAVVLLHGRGASARGILAMTDDLAANRAAGNIAYLAPQAARRSWYPASFLAPLEENEPALSSALNRVQESLDAIEEAGVPIDRTLLLGFSQGGCLVTEFARRFPRRYGGVIGLSGALIGPEGTVDPEAVEGSRPLDGTPVFLGCSDQDPYIPLDRVEETADLLGALGGDVTKRIYEGMGHTTNGEEMRHVRRILQRYVPLRPPDDETAGDPRDEPKEDAAKKDPDLPDDTGGPNGIDEIDDDVDFLRHD